MNALANALIRDRTPLALQLRDAIRTMLREEGYSGGDKLPSEQELVSRFGTSRATVREALKLLEEQRIVFCRHGVGRFLVPEPGDFLTDEITQLKGTTEMVSGLGLAPDTNVLSLREITADKDMQSRLDLQPGSSVISLERVRSAGGQPVIYSTETFPKGIVKGEIAASLFAGSLFSLMEEEWGVRVAYCKTVIHAVRLDDSVCRRIGVPDDVPWVLLDQIHYDTTDRPLLYSRDHYRDDKFEFRLLRRRR